MANTLHVQGLKDRACHLYQKVRDYRGNYNEIANDFAVIGEYAKICKEQKVLENFGEAKELIARALTALQHTFGITITNDFESMGPIEVIGLPSATYSDSTWSGKRHYEVMDRDSRMRRIFKLIQEALVEMSFEDRKLFTALELNMRRRCQMPKASDRYQDQISGLQNISRVYLGLRTIKLDMDLQALQSQESLVSLDHLFRAAPNLQEFALTGGCSGRRAVGPRSLKRITKLFDIRTSLEIRVLDLREVACTSEILLGLMKRHKQTLIDVNFTKVTLLGSWKDCLSWIHQELDLENFHLEQVYTIHRNKMASKGGFKPAAENLATASLKGKQSTRAVITNMESDTTVS